MLVIFAESSMPGDFYPKVEIVNADKIVHMGIYGLLALLCYVSFIHYEGSNIFSNSPLTWTIIICSIYGASDELHQLFVPNRSCDIWDWASDTAGAILGVLLIRYVLSRKMKLFKPKEIMHGS